MDDTTLDDDGLPYDVIEPPELTNIILSDEDRKWAKDVLKGRVISAEEPFDWTVHLPDKDHENGVDDGEPPGWYYESHREEFDL